MRRRKPSPIVCEIDRASIRQAMADAGVGVREIARRLDVRPNTISRFLAAAPGPAERLAAKILAALEER